MCYSTVIGILFCHLVEMLETSESKHLQCKLKENVKLIVMFE